MSTVRAAAPIAAVLLVAVGFLASARPIGAQFRLGGVNVEGEVEAGYLGYIERPSPSRRAKFEEYRDLSPGPFLEDLRLRFFTDDEAYFGHFGGSKWGREDQEFNLGGGRLGRWEFGFEWDQTPHLLSTTARTRAVEVSRGEWRLPARPNATSISPAQGALYNAAPELDEVSVRWDTARMFLVGTLTPNLELRAEYTRIHKDGDRPFGVAMGSPGNDFIEVLEPIEHTIHDFRLSGTFARESWQLQFGYMFSFFQNSQDRVIADNPLRSTFAAFTANATGGNSAPAFGQSSLAPDNMAHTFYLGAGVDLPLRTRATVAASYSLRLQDADFLPHTINPNIPTAGLALPQDSLEGKAGITTVNASIVNRAIPRTTLGLRYRYFDHNEMTDQLVFPAHVVNDLSLVNEARQTSAFGYSRHNVDADARYRPFTFLATTVGGGWERWNRDPVHREVPKSDEYYVKLAADWTPVDWFLARATYKPSWRRINEYNTFAHIAHTVIEDELAPAEAAQTQSVLLRKFDEGERDRQQADITLQFTPFETLTIGLNGTWRNDDYLGGRFGLRDATTWSAGVDATWTPQEQVTVSGSYVYESIFQKWKSRNRDVATVAGQSVVSDFEDWNWISDALDRVHTLQIGARIALIPRKLDWSILGSLAYALGEVDNRNETAPLTHPPGFNSTANATARRQPAFQDILIHLETGLRYWFTKNWAAGFSYAFETFDKNDWRTDGLNPFVPGSNSIYLGNELRNYTAHMVKATLRYTFK
jgi:MtrB/PioB family decaheme-associated outer membrane protein